MATSVADMYLRMERKHLEESYERPTQKPSTTGDRCVTYASGTAAIPENGVRATIFPSECGGAEETKVNKSRSVLLRSGYV